MNEPWSQYQVAREIIQNIEYHQLKVYDGISDLEITLTDEERLADLLETVQALLSAVKLENDTSISTVPDLHCTAHLLRHDIRDAVYNIIFEIEKTSKEKS